MSENIEKTAQNVSAVVSVLLVSTLVGVGGGALYGNREEIAAWYNAIPTPEKLVREAQKETQGQMWAMPTSQAGAFAGANFQPNTPRFNMQPSNFQPVNLQPMAPRGFRGR